MGPKIPGVGPSLGTQWKLDKQDVEVPEWKRSGCDAAKVARSRRGLVRWARPELEDVCTR